MSESQSVDDYVAGVVYTEDEPTRQRGLTMYRHMASAATLVSVLDALDTQPPELLRGYLISRIQALEVASSVMARDLEWPINLRQWFRDLTRPYLVHHARRSIAQVEPTMVCDEEGCYELSAGALFDGIERVGQYCLDHLQRHGNGPS